MEVQGPYIAAPGINQNSPTFSAVRGGAEKVCALCSQQKKESEDPQTYRKTCKTGKCRWEDIDGTEKVPPSTTVLGYKRSYEFQNRQTKTKIIQLPSSPLLFMHLFPHQLNNVAKTVPPTIAYFFFLMTLIRIFGSFVKFHTTTNLVLWADNEINL